MYEVKVNLDFSSAHNLRAYKGKCEALHGHNWNVEIIVRSKNVNQIGMVVDFHDLKKILKEILVDLDHVYLNEIEFFKEKNPTSENIAKYIYDKIKEKEPLLNLVRVNIWETSNSMASYISCDKVEE